MGHNRPHLWHTLHVWLWRWCCVAHERCKRVFGSCQRRSGSGKFETHPKGCSSVDLCLFKSFELPLKNLVKYGLKICSFSSWNFREPSSPNRSLAFWYAPNNSRLDIEGRIQSRLLLLWYCSWRLLSRTAISILSTPSCSWCLLCLWVDDIVRRSIDDLRYLSSLIIFLKFSSKDDFPTSDGPRRLQNRTSTQDGLHGVPRSYHDRPSHINAGSMGPYLKQWHRVTPRLTWAIFPAVCIGDAWTDIEAINVITLSCTIKNT